MSIPLDLALLKDVILLLISGIACLYCVLLNRRLKGLNDLKSGVGASIVSLTQAIKETHKAAKTAQSSTIESIETLKDLLDKSNEASLRMEAETIAIQRNVKRAIAVNAGLQVKVQTDLPDAIQRAQTTASNLLKVVADIERYNATQDKTDSKKPIQSSGANPTASANKKITKVSHLKVVEKPVEVLTAAEQESRATQVDDITTNIAEEEVHPEEFESENIFASELAKHFDDEALKETTMDVRHTETNLEHNTSAIEKVHNKELEESAQTLLIDSDIDVDVDVDVDTLEKITGSPKDTGFSQPIETGPILQRIPPLVVTPNVSIEASLDKVTELNAFERQSASKDPIDELFDNIDHLVKSKGVAKGMGFLKSREYYKS